MMTPFEEIVRRAQKQARVSPVKIRFPFGLDRNEAAARRLHGIDDDIHNPLGHEPELAHLIDLLVSDDGVFVDVGANLGYFPAYLATRTGFAGCIHAFEPVTATYATLQAILHDLGCADRVHLHKVAASNVAGEARIAIVSPDHFISSLEGDARSDQSEVVQLARLDDFGIARADLIKIDVERHELAALQGAEKLFQTCKPFLYLESSVIHGDPEKTLAPLRLLESWNYTLFLSGWKQSNGDFFIGIGRDIARDEFGLLPFRADDRAMFPFEVVNIFAAPSDRLSEIGKA